MKDQSRAGIPLNEWIKGPLKDVFYETMSDENLSHNLLNKSKIKKMLDDHIDGKEIGKINYGQSSFQNWFHENKINSMHNILILGGGGLLVKIF